jgi:hypothetical protein
MRGTTLANMVQMFRLETGQSMQLAQGQQTREHVKHALNRTQEILYGDFDWPFLRIYRDENLLAGENIYSWPDDLVVEDVRQLYDSYNGRYTPINYGIGMDDRNAFGPDDRSDPALRWQIVDARQYEVWPTPASPRTLKIYGYRAYVPLLSDGDTCILDDNMIVLFAAAEWLARNKLPDAAAKLDIAKRLRARLQGRLVSDKRRNVIPLVAGQSPNAVYLARSDHRNVDYRAVYGLPPPIPR